MVAETGSKVTQDKSAETESHTEILAAEHVHGPGPYVWANPRHEALYEAHAGGRYGRHAQHQDYQVRNVLYVADNFPDTVSGAGSLNEVGRTEIETGSEAETGTDVSKSTIGKSDRATLYVAECCVSGREFIHGSERAWAVGVAAERKVAVSDILVNDILACDVMIDEVISRNGDLIRQLMSVGIRGFPHGTMGPERRSGGRESGGSVMKSEKVAALQSMDSLRQSVPESIKKVGPEGSFAEMMRVYSECTHIRCKMKHAGGREGGGSVKKSERVTEPRDTVTSRKIPESIFFRGGFIFKC